MDLKSELLAHLKPFGQDHLLAYWDELSPADRQRLAADIRGLDFARLQKLRQGDDVSASEGGDDWAALAARAQSPPAFRLGSAGKITPAAARSRGEQALRAGEVGVVLVAGGQGTRLGFDRPKGIYPIGSVSAASLFEILLKKLRAVRTRVGQPIPLFIMTSPETDQATRGYLNARGRFGLPAEDVVVFCQGTMPAVDAKTGRVLLAERGQIFFSPDGHGGMLAALRGSGALAELERRGIRQLFYLQVDNPLVDVCDPEFIGYHLLARSEISTQVVAKTSPTDRVGNVVEVDGRIRIIEYSDLPLADAERRAADGSLALWAGNIAVHVFEVELLSRVSATGGGLPFHQALKKVWYLDDKGQQVQPAEPNAIKFEQFIFDLLPQAERAIVVEVDEATSFAPVKNGPGATKDTPATVRAQMSALHAGWLRAAGVAVPPGMAVEISPLFATSAADVASRLSAPLELTEPTFFE